MANKDWGSLNPKGEYLSQFECPCTCHPRHGGRGAGSTPSRPKDTELIDHATDIRMRAEIRAGEILGRLVAD